MNISGTVISVIMPVRNGVPYVADAIRSVLAQTFPNFELLIIDDGSTDSSMTIAAEFQSVDARVRIVRSPGSGLVDALNHGIAIASAPLIARMDADDISLPERFQRQWEFLNKHPEIAVVGAQVTYIDRRGESAGAAGVFPFDPKAIAKTLVNKGCCLHHPSVLMRRQAVEKVGGYRPELVAAEDYDLWLRLSEHFALANLPDTLLLYRIHSAQVSEEKEWTQRLSRNLALLAALERRRNSDDPIDSYACFTKDAARQRCQHRGCPNCVCDTLRAFETAEQVVASNGSSELMRENVWQMLSYLSQTTMGDGQQMRLRILVALCREAIRLRAPLVFAAAIGMALRVHPGRTLKWLMARPPQQNSL